MSAPVDVLAVMHDDTVARRDLKTMDFHVKSYSYDFVCPDCGKARRYNTNFVGGRRVPVCNGAAIKLTPKLSWDDYQALTGGVRC